jgi:hypothetical protein
VENKSNLLIPRFINREDLNIVKNSFERRLLQSNSNSRFRVDFCQLNNEAKPRCEINVGQVSQLSFHINCERVIFLVAV